MAKINLTKICPEKVSNLQPKVLEINGQQIEVKQYLPLGDKISMLEDTISKIDVAKEYINPIQRDVLINLAIIEYYTNISITKAQKEKLYATYDSIVLNDIFNTIVEAIPSEEIAEVIGWYDETLSELNKYNSSARGIVDSLSNSYDSTKLNLDELLQNIKDPAMEEFIKNLSKVN